MVRLSPSSSLPASVTFDPMVVTCSVAPFRQFELRVELPMRCPRELRVITIVSVNPELKCLENNEPDHVPCNAEDTCSARPEAEVFWGFGLPGADAATGRTPAVAGTTNASKIVASLFVRVIVILSRETFMKNLTELLAWSLQNVLDHHLFLLW